MSDDVKILISSRESEAIVMTASDPEVLVMATEEKTVYMPIASKTVHGIMRVGEGLDVTSDGTVSVSQEILDTPAIANEALETANDAKALAEEAIQIANDAESLAYRADTNAENAVGTANEAKATAEEADSKADTAINTAGTALTNSTNAVQTSNRAYTMALDASGRSTNAVTIANRADNMARNANALAEDASEKSTEALRVANSISGVANTAYDLANRIESYIPAEASTTNKLADKNFVNSSIATETSYFRGTYDDESELPTTGITNNDYAYVIVVDSAGNTRYDRYKYNAQDREWVYEYSLNNSSFTAAQWATINSGLTAEQLSEIEDTLSEIYDNYASKEYVDEFGGKIDSISINGVPQLIDVDKNVDLTIPTKYSDLTDDIGYLEIDTDGFTALTGTNQLEIDYELGVKVNGFFAAEHVNAQTKEMGRVGVDTAYNSTSAGLSVTNEAGDTQKSIAVIGTGNDEFKAVIVSVGNGQIDMQEIATVDDIPTQYLKNATVSDNTLTITKQDGTIIEFGGGSDNVLLKPENPTDNVFTYVTAQNVQQFVGLDYNTMEIVNNRLSSGIELVEV